MKLTRRQLEVLRLIQRSPEIANGWVRVSKPLWNIVHEMPLDLVETALHIVNEEDCYSARMTQEGKSLVKWI